MGRVKDWMMELEAKGCLPDKEYNKMIEQEEKETVRASVLNEANSIVNGARANTYGGPEDSFNTIAALWSAYTSRPYTASDVAVMLALLKVARLKNSPDHRDSWVDLAGYAACGAECGLK